MIDLAITEEPFQSCSNIKKKEKIKKKSSDDVEQMYMSSSKEIKINKQRKKNKKKVSHTVQISFETMITERKTIKKKNGLQKTSIAIITTSIAYSEGNPKQLTSQTLNIF